MGEFENLNSNLEFVFNAVVNKAEFYYTKDYFINITGDKFVIINPENLNYLILNNHGLKFKEYNCSIQNNNLYLENTSSNEIFKNVQVFDIDSLYKTNKAITIPLLLAPNWLQTFYFKYATIIWGIILLILSGFIFIKYLKN